MKIFEMNDCDWWMAETIEQAVEDYEKLTGVLEQEATALDEDAMNRLKFWDTDSRDPQDYCHWVCECGYKADADCRWNGRAYEHHHGYPVGHVEMNNIDCRTFAQEMARRVAAGVKSEFFASTES